MKNIVTVKFLSILLLLLFLGCTESKEKEIDLIDSITHDSINLKYLSLNQNKIKSLTNKADTLFQSDKNSKVGYSIWCDSIPRLMEGLYIKPYVFTDINQEELNLDKIKKPIFLQVTDAWKYTYKLNKLVQTYSNKVEFIFIFVEDSTNLRSEKTKYNREINLIPNKELPWVDNKVSISKIDIAGFVHQVGFPFNYYISSKKQIIKAEIADSDCRLEKPKYSIEKTNLIIKEMERNIELLLKIEEDK